MDFCSPAPPRFLRANRALFAAERGDQFDEQGSNRERVAASPQLARIGERAREECRPRMAWRFALSRGEAAGAPLPGGAESSLAEAAIVQGVCGPVIAAGKR
jgi:hypothetical protein